MEISDELVKCALIPQCDPCRNLRMNMFRISNKLVMLQNNRLKNDSEFRIQLPNSYTIDLQCDCRGNCFPTLSAVRRIFGSEMK